MTPPHTHRERAAEAASYAGRLHADLISLSGMLNHYRDGGAATTLEELARRSSSAQRELLTISQRIDSLGGLADPQNYMLSEQEHAVLDGAYALREKLMKRLGELQQDELAAARRQRR